MDTEGNRCSVEVEPKLLFKKALFFEDSSLEEMLRVNSSCNCKCFRVIVGPHIHRIYVF